MKKQVYTAVLAAVLAGSMIGTSVSAEEGQTFTVGICQLVQHEALDAATQGFKDALTENFGDSVIFDEQNAQGDPNTCSTIINSFVSNGVDLILANATASLQAAAAGTKSRSSVLRSQSTASRLRLKISTEQSAEISPALPTLRRLMNRQLC